LKSFQPPRIIETDLVVVGSGAAGLTAALAAARHGASALVLEKTSLVGGTTAYSEAMIWVPCSGQARNLSVPDSQQEALDYIAAVAGEHFDHERTNAYLEAAPMMLAFVEANSKVSYSLALKTIDYYPDKPGAKSGARSLMAGKFDGRLLGKDFIRLRPPLQATTILGGMSIAGIDLPHFYQVGRSLRATLAVARLIVRYMWDRMSGWPRGTRIGNGEGVIAALWHAFQENGGELRTGAAVERLLLEEGRVTGVEFSQDGRPWIARARQGVILATGGFSANPDLRNRFAPELATGATFVQLSSATATGDGLTMAEEVGASVETGLDQPMAWAPTSWVPHKGSAFPHFLERAKPGIIMISGDGKRFANEAMIYHDLVPKMLAARRSSAAKSACWIVADHRAQRRYGLGAAPPAPATTGSAVRAGYLIKARSLAELARRIGLDASILEETIARFNAAAILGVDPEFQRGASDLDRAYGDPLHQPNPCLGPLTQPPFYAVRVDAGDLGSLVGLRTNASAQILGEEGDAIPGLYAAGLDAASPMGGYYPAAGVTVGAAMTFGWIAAMHALGLNVSTYANGADK
jgi:succinate dehydrogenase/fumarate reductase flavoprotein subunit